MNTLARLLPVAVLCLASAPGPAPQDDDPVFVDEVKKDFLDKVDRCRAASDWKGLFDLQAQAAHPKNVHKLVRLPGVEARYVGLIEHLHRKFVELPPEALKYYRGQFDGAARREFDRARAAGDREGLERVVSTWFYSSRTDEALDLLANLHVEEGRLDLAIHCWTRLLHHYPDSEIPREISAARLASAAAEAGLDSVLQGVRNHARDRQLTGAVIVGDQSMGLEPYLDTLKVEAPPVAPAAVAKEPSIPVPDRSALLRLTAIRPEVRRWSSDLSPAPEPQQRGRPQPQAPASDLPYLPAYARIAGYEMVVYTNGFRVTVIDPSRANTVRPEEGIYFTYPPPGEQLTRAQLPSDQWGRGGVIGWMRPYIGVTIDGEHAFATLYSGKRPRENPPPGVWGMADTLFGMMRLVCLNLRTQQVVWDTDFGEAGALLRKMEFWDRNFAFSGPPLVVGDRVYAGIGTSPLSEEESRVVCFDRRTGHLLWERFLASVSMGTRAMGAGSFTSRLTVLAEDRGSLVALSNIGAIASLDAVTGQVRWLSRYTRSSAGQNPWGQAQVFARPASPVVLHRGKVYALPQDAHDLLVVDLETGALQREIGQNDARHDPQWREIQRLVGRMGEYLVLARAGGDSCILSTVSGQYLGLTATNTSGMGRGSIDGETLYLPTVDGGRGGLSVIHGLKQWRHFEGSVMWWSLGEPANVIRAGNYLIAASNSKISIFADSELVRSEYRRRLEQSPPNPAAWLEYGLLMKTNERWAEAARAYLAFLDAVQGDTEWIGRAREVRTDLHTIFMNRGKKALEQKQGREAADHYGRARDFSFDLATLTEATRKLAEACEDVAKNHPSETERKNWARRAVEEYQELIRRAPPGFIAPSSGTLWVPIRKFASIRIAELLKSHGAEAYEGVAKMAADELKKAGRSPAALQALADLYPDSPSAVEALERIAELSAAQGQGAASAATLRILRSRVGDKWTASQQKRLIEAVEKTGDAERLALELARMERQFDAASKLGPEEQSPTVGEFLAKARAAAASVPKRKPEPPAASTSTLSTWEPSTGPAWTLLIPGGLEPASWPADHEFFARGSTVELWNIKSKKKLWSSAHPGSWTGIVFSDASDTAREVRVIDVKPESPGAKAGLSPGDLIRSVDGAPVSGEDFDVATETRPPGTTLAIVYRRGTESRRTDLTTAPWPDTVRPAVVGALFTAGGSLAVGWEDLVACLDPADGKVRWVSRPGRDRFVIRSIHAAADRILAHEHYLPDRCRSALRTPPREGARAALPPEDCHGRVFGLEEATGEPLWALAFRFDPNLVSHHSVQFLGRPLDTHAGLVVTGAQNVQMKTSELVPLSVEDGKEGTKIQLSGNQQGSAWIVEPKSGTLWLVDGGGRRLRSFTLPDYARGLDFTLDGHVDPNATGYGLTATEDRVAVASVSPAPMAPRIALFSAKDGSLIASHKPGEGPLKDRVLPGHRVTMPERKLMPGLITLEPDGQLLVYNEAKTAGGAGGGRRASLSALSVAGGSFKLEWDAVTPTLMTVSLAEKEFLTVRCGPKGYFVTTHRGIAPGKQEESAIVAFHSRKDEGAVRKLFDDLVSPVDAFGQKRDPAPVHRGRIFLNRKGGLEILGE